MYSLKHNGWFSVSADWAFAMLKVKLADNKKVI